MKPFLQSIAEKLQKNHQGKFEDVLILSPNRRTYLFLEQHLMRLQSKPIWAPQFMTVNQLVKDLCPYVEADKLTAIFELHQYWNKWMEVEEPFERFYFFGDQILEAFNEIDRYLVNAEELFQDLSDQHKIDLQFQSWKAELKEHLKTFWSAIQASKATNLGNELPIVDNFISFWEKLGGLKSDFEQGILEKQLCTSGSMFRYVASNLDLLKKHEDQVIYLVGFNKMNACEKKIAQYLQTELGAKILWNYDINFFSQAEKYQHAGWFIPNTKEQRAESSFSASDMENQTKTVKLYEVNKEVGQAKLIGQLLEDSPYEPEEILIVLPTEILLFPLLNALPETLKRINLSMGIALKETAVYDFITAYFELQESWDNKSQTYPRKELNRILLHPLVKRQIQAFKRLHISPTQPELQNDELLCHICMPLENLQLGSNIKHLLKLMEKLYYLHLDTSDETEVGVESNTDYYHLELIAHTYRSLQRMLEVFDTYQAPISIEGLFKIISQHLAQSRVAFKGEPLSGVQILGILEMRNLDFKHVIIPHMNEGYFPPPQKGSLIPFRLQQAFEMPTFIEENAENAYYFYMAIARAEKVDLLYNGTRGELRGEEPSRYLKSLQYLPRTHWEKIEPYQLINDVRLNFATDFTIPKSKAHFKQIQSILEQGISPSAINTYLQCSMRFYFKYIERIDTDFDPDGGFSELNIGRVLHKAMELMYEPFEGKLVQAKDIEKLYELKDKYIEKSILSEMGEHQDFLDHGENLILFDLIQKYMDSILDYDQARAPFLMKGHEIKINYPLTLGELKVRIKGKVDRTDENEEQTTIIDYKTGKVGSRENPLRIFGIEDAFDPKNLHKEAVQLFVYALVEKEKSNKPDIDVQLYSTRLMNQENYKGNLVEQPSYAQAEPLKLTPTKIQEIGETLELKIKELLNADIPFTMTEDRNKCSYCPYNQLCKRK